MIASSGVTVVETPSVTASTDPPPGAAPPAGGGGTGGGGTGGGIGGAPEGAREVHVDVVEV